jgi:hypothetical protein
VTSKQKFAIALAAAAAAALLFCALSKQWFKVEGRGGEVRFGLLSVERCVGTGDAQQCTVMSLQDELADARESDDSVDTWLTASVATFYLALVCVLALLATAALGFRRHDKVATVGKLTLLIIIATIGACIFVMSKRPIFLSASLGVFLFMTGGMAGAIAAHLLSSDSTYVEEHRDPSIPRL